MRETDVERLRSELARLEQAFEASASATEAVILGRRLDVIEGYLSALIREGEKR